MTRLPECVKPTAGEQRGLPWPPGDISERDATRHRHGHTGARWDSRADGKRRAELGSSLAHADEPEVAGSLTLFQDLRIDAPAVIGDSNPQASGTVVDVERDDIRASVTTSIANGFARNVHHLPARLAEKRSWTPAHRYGYPHRCAFLPGRSCKQL